MEALYSLSVPAGRGELAAYGREFHDVDISVDDLTVLLRDERCAYQAGEKREVWLSSGVIVEDHLRAVEEEHEGQAADSGGWDAQTWEAIRNHSENWLVNGFYGRRLCPCGTPVPGEIGLVTTWMRGRSRSLSRTRPTTAGRVPGSGTIRRTLPLPLR
jgi:hypothetical protein